MKTELLTEARCVGCLSPLLSIYAWCVGYKPVLFHTCRHANAYFTLVNVLVLPGDFSWFTGSFFGAKYGCQKRYSCINVNNPHVV